VRSKRSQGNLTGQTPPTNVALTKATNTKISGHLGLCLRKTRSGKSRDHRDVIVCEKIRFQNVFRPHDDTKLAFSNSSGLKNVSKLCFLDGLAWTVGLTVEIKLRFRQISTALVHVDAV